MKYIVMTKLISTTTRRIVGYRFKNKYNNKEYTVGLEEARKSSMYVINAYLSNGFYKKKNGYPDIGTEYIDDRKKNTTHNKSKSKQYKKQDTTNQRRDKKQDTTLHDSSKPKQYKKQGKINQSTGSQKHDRHSEKNLLASNKDDEYTNLYTKRENPNSNPVPGHIKRHKLKNIENLDGVLGAEYIDTCMTIRTAARANRLTIDTTVHDVNEGWNVQLFKIIEACGMEVEEFIRQYLAVLQPYALIPFDDDTDKSEGNVWVVETGYSVGLLIKTDIYDKQSPLIISFHESNIKGNLLMSDNRNLKNDVLCAVIPEKIKKINENENTVAAFIAYIQHGFIRIKMERRTSMYGHGAVIVKYRHIAEEYDLYINEMYKFIEKRHFSNQEYPVIDDNFTDADKSVNRVGYENFSFPSFGHMDINSFYFLEDAYRVASSVDETRMIRAEAIELRNRLGSKRFEELREAVLARQASISSGGILEGVFKEDEE